MPREIEPSSADRECQEFCYVDEHGRKQDAAMHEEMLDNPEADDRWARQAIASAVADGLTLTEALSLYATDRIRSEHGLPPRQPLPDADGRPQE